jgi:hypothetical protein
VQLDLVGHVWGKDNGAAFKAADGWGVLREVRGEVRGEEMGRRGGEEEGRQMVGAS